MGIVQTRVDPVQAMKRFLRGERLIHSLVSPFSRADLIPSR
jgi:hypothetical protein